MGKWIQNILHSTGRKNFFTVPISADIFRNLNLSLAYTYNCHLFWHLASDIAAELKISQKSSRSSSQDA